KGFTLVELIVVTVIISVLMALLVGAVGASLREADSCTCMNNLKQIGNATILYSRDNNDFLPRSTHSAMANHTKPWGYALCPYLGGGNYTGPGPAWDALFNGIYRCPLDARRNKWSYGKNVWFELTAGEILEIDGPNGGITYPSLSSIRRPSATILYGELGSGSMADHIMAHFWYFGGSSEVDSKRHGSVSNYVFADGHGEAREFASTFDLKAHIDLWDPARAR
ncbi:MAG: DUF1559 domain-containing protein, partial [Planctomycetota bacterium]|nr:DUF1559 domain-containing protein [Planctomycetota bacterium]